MPLSRQGRAWAIVAGCVLVLLLLLGACAEVIEAVAESVGEAEEQDDDDRWEDD